MTSHRNGTRHPGIRILPALAAVLAVAFGSTGCSDKKKKAAEVIEQAVKKCRKSNDAFHAVSLMNGSDEQEVLAETCEEKMGKVEMVDEFSAEAEVGPYLWRAGLDDATGIWTMQSVRWEDLNQARKHLDNDDPGKNILQHAEKRLGKAQKAYPNSSWIRLKRLETRLRVRALDRKVTKSGLDLGERFTNYLEETVQWARDNGDKATEAKAKLQAIDYYFELRRELENAIGALGAQDVHLKRAAKLAEDRGHDKKAEQYRKELEKLKKKRPERKERYDKLLEQTKATLCDRLDQLPTSGLDDSKLMERINRSKNQVRCSTSNDGENNGGGESTDENP